MKSDKYDIHVYSFGNLSVRAFKDNEVWFVANDISDALGYKNIGAFSYVPATSRRKFCIYAPREKKEFLCINIQGIYHILEHSHSKNIHAFHKWFYDVIGGNIRSNNRNFNSDFLKEGFMQNALVILQTAGVTGEKAAITLDKIFKSCTGKSVLELADFNFQEVNHE